MTWIASSPDERRAQFGRFLLGTGNIGGIAVATGPGLGLSDDEGFDVIDRAVAAGVRILDTADAYTGGNSERVVGLWNAAHADAGVLIQTKTGMTGTGPDLAPERIARQLDHSIAALGRVDLYLAHAVDTDIPWSASLPVFSGAVESGRIRAYGLSNVNEAALTAALETADRLGLARPELVQNAYSLLVREDDGGVLPLVQSEGLAYTPYSPLANGILAGRYSNGEQPATGSRAGGGPRARALLDDAERMKRVKRFDEIAASHDISPAGLALAWVIKREAVTAPIIGISKESQWDGVHQALGFVWPTDLAEQLDDLFPAR
jgi:1-deoxyxylulose-5-phosphate synthase